MKKICLIILISISFQCSKMDDSIKLEKNGLTKDINMIITQNIIDTFLDLGITINSGTNPPELNNTYLISPVILTNSNIQGDVIGRQYLNTVIRFYDFNRDRLTVSVDVTEGSSSTVTYNGYMVGEGTLFTIFFEVTKSNGVRLAFVYSGSVNSYGIYNLTFALYMIDNLGIVGYIANDSCRTFQDGDLSSEIIEQSGKSQMYSGGGFNIFSIL